MDVKKLIFLKAVIFFKSDYPNYVHLFLFLHFVVNRNSKVSEESTASFFREAAFVQVDAEVTG